MFVVRLKLINSASDKSCPAFIPQRPNSKMTRLRRKSLDSVNEACSTTDPMKILFRVTDLEKRINKTIQQPLSQIDENGKVGENSRPFPTNSIVILSENESESPRRNPNVSRVLSDADRPSFVCDEPDVSRSGPENFRSLNEDHASLLHSIEHEVSQIESLVREHSNSMSDLEMSRDLSSSLQDVAWIADLTHKCGDIKQQIVMLQEFLKHSEGNSAAMCTRCCQVPEGKFSIYVLFFLHELNIKVLASEHCFIIDLFHVSRIKLDRIKSALFIFQASSLQSIGHYFLRTTMGGKVTICSLLLI